VADTFSASIIRGTYALTLTGQGGWAPLAGIGVLKFDGAGHVSGSWRESRPGAGYGDRVLTDVVYEARYDLTANGTGRLTASGSEEEDGYLAIRDLESSDGEAAASELAFIFRSLGASGGLKTATGRRLPEGAVFNARSLRGRYIGAALGLGGQFPIAGFGAVVYDGEGGFSEDNISNVQGDTFRARRFVTGTDQGAYTVNPDGTGTVAGGGVVFVITQARLAGDHSIVEEYSFLVPELMPTNGAQFTGTVKRVTD
jgi:hypothetical protein